MSSITPIIVKSVLLCFLAVHPCEADPAVLRLASIFGDNMVLQQNQAVPIWGWSRPKASITVKFYDKKISAQADATGHWLVKLSNMKASATPQSLTVESGEIITFTNILVGEVWLCSGQSNMEKPIGRLPDPKVTTCFNAEEELARANYPNIRIFKITKNFSASALPDFKSSTGWLACSSNSLDTTSFSAAAYFFGREIHTNLNVPVGLIESVWGATPIEPWTPAAGFESVPSLAGLAQPMTNADQMRNKAPMVIYNAMIAPIVGFAMRGVLWYQGESNCVGDNVASYEDKMVALVGGWRKAWGEGDFPFYFVQIAPYLYSKIKPPRVSSPEILPEFWLTQSHAAQRIKNTGMAVTTDLVENLHEIHPRDKQSVGHRLALLALRKTYGQGKVVCSGPTFKRMKVSGSKAVLKFDHADGGLVSKDSKPLTWFTIAGGDNKFVAADAKVVGDSVEVSAAQVKKPVVVRFAWDETAQPNFFNQAGLPAVPFRTDDPVNDKQ